MAAFINYTLKSGDKEMDYDRVTDMLKDVWWSPGIKKTEIIKGAQNSALLTGAFVSGGEQVGYARVISDKTRFAYILDVVVDSRYRKQGIGTAMINFILHHPELKDVYQWMLLTRDAHAVYQKTGFHSLSTPADWMEIRYNRPDR